MQLWTMKLLLLSNFGNKQMEKPTTSLTVSFQVLPLWYRYYLLNYHGLNSHYLERCNHSAWQKRTLEAQTQQIFRLEGNTHHLQSWFTTSTSHMAQLMCWEKRETRFWWKAQEILYVCAHSVMSDSLQLHGLEPTRLLCSWDFSGKNTGVGCHFHMSCYFLPWWLRW